MTTPRCRPRRTSLPPLPLRPPRQDPPPPAARPSSPSQPDGEPPLQATAAGQSHTLQLDFATCTDHPRSRTHHKSRNSGTSTPKNPLRSTGGPRVTGFRDLAAASSGSGGGPSGGGGGGGGFGGFGRLGGGGGGDDSDDDGDEGKDPSSFYTGGAKRYVLAPPPPPLPFLPRPSTNGADQQSTLSLVRSGLSVENPDDARRRGGGGGGGGVSDMLKNILQQARE